ncbi:MAG TPA: invasion associated locus B family protein [Devosiaceae bacterium]
MFVARSACSRLLSGEICSAIEPIPRSSYFPIRALALQALAVCVALLELTLPTLAASSAPAAQPDPSQGWVRICDTPAEQTRCRVEREVAGSDGKLSASITVWPKTDTGNPGVAIKVPTDTIILSGLVLTFDNKKASLKAPYHFCDEAYCVADRNLPASLIDRLKKGLELSVIRTDGKMTSFAYHFSLKGFTAAYNGD